MRSFYAAGVPVCFGSDSPVTPLRPWSSVRACLQHNNPAEQISARAAFLGHTRAGWRAARYRNPMAGQLVPGAPASFAVWEVEELMVQVADGRVQSWSTDPRARTPLLPALDTGTDPAASRPSGTARNCTPRRASASEGCSGGRHCTNGATAAVNLRRIPPQ